MSGTLTFRTFATPFKLEAVQRIEGGAAVAALSRELSVSRKLLYEWYDSWKAAGPAGLNRKR